MTAVTDARKKVALDEREQTILAELTELTVSPRRPSPVLQELLGGVLVEGQSEARLLSAILRLGFDRVQEARRDAGYAALAEQQRTDPDQQAEQAAQRAHRNRRAAAWADA